MKPMILKVYFLVVKVVVKKHDFTNLIQSKLSKISQLVKTPVTPLHASSFSNYDCSICNQSIPNSSQILSITSGPEIREGNVATPCNEIMIAVACINCADKYQVSSHVKQLIKDIVNESNNEK